MNRYKIRFTIVLLFFTVFSFAQDDVSYKTPPKDIMDLVMARPTPAVSIDNKAEWMVLQGRTDFPSIEELAQPEWRIAGLRINPGNFSPSRTGSFNSLQLKHIKSGQLHEIEGLPANLRASSLQWSPDEKRFAFVNSTGSTVDLYVVDVAAKKATRINKTPLNMVLGNAFQWAGNNMLVYKTTVPGRQLSAKPPAPSGPIVQENLGKAAASRTYQDLIKKPIR